MKQSQIQHEMTLQNVKDQIPHEVGSRAYQIQSDWCDRWFSIFVEKGMSERDAAFEVLQIVPINHF